MNSTKVAVSSILAAGFIVSIWVVASMIFRPAAPPSDSRAPTEPRRQEARTPRDVESEPPSPPDAAPEIPSDPVRPPGRRLVVRVTDEAGAPLPGATVSRRRDVVDVRFSERPVTYAKSDADGILVWDGLEPGRYEWRLTIDGEADDDWRLPFSVRVEEDEV